MKVSTLLWIYALLVVLLAATLGIAYLPVSGWLKALAGMVVAMAKAILIALYFMDIRYQSGLVRVFAGAGVLWLLLLFVLTAADYLTRQWL